MRHSFSLSLSLALAWIWAGCSSSPTDALSGQIGGAENATVTVSNLGPNGYVAFDTVQASFKPLN